MGEIMNNIGYEIERLLKFALKKNMISKWDVIPTRNALIDLLKLESPFEGEVEEVSEETPVKILNNILDYAVEAGLIEENTTTYRDLFDARIMGLLMPRESEIVKEFYNKYENESKEKATSWFYDLSKSSNYIMTQRIAKNLWWPVQTEYGALEITINLSKPEKDPKEIAKAKLMKQLTYPKCLLCKENVGYAGRVNHPARQNHRIIPMTLGNKDWFLQYSPYVYYNEHCIVFSGEHEPMKLTKNSIERLVEFTEVLPHYFIGSNADLPIVGGSILTHDHYQGGRHEFPMEKAKVEKYYESSKYKNLEIGIVKWPMSVVRIKGKDKNEVINATMDMFEAWKKYSDEENEILAFTGDTPHNTVTPIARRKDEAFEIDIVLRNNRASEEHPDGIFHPHKELHHIKKENIGLIEVMGLAVLPGRLEKELDIIANILCGEISYNREKAQNNEEINKHIPWIEKMLSENLSLNYLEAKELIKKESEKKEKLNEIKNARMKDIDIEDKNRYKVIKWLKKYFDDYEKVNTLKGLYLHGSFGSGKTYLISALFNELEISKDAITEVVYLPETLRNMKEDFSLVEDKVNYLKNVDILLIDDIGAENVTAWGRDEILGTILQYRMNNKLSTFFTSNLTLEELEVHLSLSKNSEDKVKARRIIERIKELTEDLELVSINRRS